uniref:HAD hydrolase, family IA, variant 3 n=1 Tax=Syphacia muris TaxID=451379 RepID=A0A0N5AX28_9BILA
MASERDLVTHIIFDLDGLLIDTESLYTEAHVKACEKFGKTYTMEIKVKTMGMKHEFAVAYLLQQLGLDGEVSVDEYSNVYVPILYDLLPRNSMLPGAIELIRYFSAKNIPMAICTGSNRKEFELKTQNHHEMLKLIPIRVLTGDDPEVKRGKPDPDAFIVTMNRFKVKPKCAKNVLVFEDAPNGVRAAVAAGMQVVMVPDLTYSKPPEDVANKISCVLTTLREFDPSTFGL